MKTNKNTADDNRTVPTKPRLDLLNKSDKPRSLDAIGLAITCLEQVNFSAAAIHLVNMLAFHLQCDRISIGMRNGHHVELSALSNNASFDSKTNLIRNMTAAMDESIDEKSAIIYSSTGDDEPRMSVAHEQLAKFQGGRDIYTIPLRYRDQCIGAICLERAEDEGFDSAIVQHAEKIAELIGPLLFVLHQEQRGIYKRSKDYFNDAKINIFGREKSAAHIIGISFFVALVFFSFFPSSYRVTANVTMEGSSQRIMAAPVDGYIAMASKRAGDVVIAGDLIATLDDKDLKLEEIKLKSQRQQLQRKYRSSLASRDRSKVNIFNAQISQANANLELVTEQLSRLQLIAPIDGMIIEGDLTQSIGSPVSRGDVLFKVSPSGSYRVILNVDESEISQIKIGQTGQLALSAIPDKRLDITVSNITPVSTSENGRTFFRVEANLESKNQQLQPGMEGVGKIEVGDRNLIWVITHKAMDKIRLMFWYFRP
jgi:RND family efflux transporter MFP subunit